MSASAATSTGLPDSLVLRLWRLATSRPVLSIGDQGIVSAGNLFSVIIITRMCSRAEYGVYALAFTLTVLFALVQQSLITEAYKVFVHRYEDDERRRYTGSTLAHQLAFTLIAIVGLGIATLVAPLVSPEGAAARVLIPLAPVLGPLTIVIAATLFKEYARQLSLARLQPAYALALDGAAAFTQVSLLLLLAWQGKLNAQNAVYALGAAAALGIAGWLPATWGNFRVATAEILNDFRKNWTIGRWIFAYAILFALSVQSYPWMIGAMHGVEATGTYTACFMVVNLMANPLVNGLGSFLGPKTAQAFANGGVDALAPVVAKSTLFFAVALGVFCLGLFVFGGWLLTLLSGAKYTGNGLVVFVIALAQLAWACTVPANSALYAMEKAQAGFQALVCAFVVTVTVGAGLVWFAGPLGAAGGMLAGNCAACAYTWFALSRHMPLAGARRLVNA